MTASIHKPPSREAARWRYEELLSMLGHDLRTPLDEAMGSLEILDGMNLTADVRDHLGTARCRLLNLRTLLEGILKCAEMKEGHLPVNLRMADLAGILKTLVDQFSVGIGRKGIRCEVELAPDLPEKLYLDEVKVRQIAENLLSNALKYTPSGGTITIRADAVGPPRERTLSPGIFKIEVEDTGKGISKDDLERVFDPFFAGSAQEGELRGAGLGLAIVEKLVATLGGSITLKSSPGVGTMVTVVLPFPTEDSDVQIMRVPEPE